MTVLEGLIMSLESDGSIQAFVHVPPSSGPWTISTHHSTRMGKPSSSSPPVMGTNQSLWGAASLSSSPPVMCGQQPACAYHSTSIAKPPSSSPPVMGTNADLVAKPSNPQVPQSCLPVSGQHGPTITLV